MAILTQKQFTRTKIKTLLGNLSQTFGKPVRNAKEKKSRLRLRDCAKRDGQIFPSAISKLVKFHRRVSKRELLKALRFSTKELYL